MAKKIQFSLEERQAASALLLPLGYDEKAVEGLLSLAAAQVKISALVSHHALLVETWQLTHKQVISVVKRSRGQANLDALAQRKAGLIVLGYTIPQILRMVSHDRGYKNLEAVQGNQTALQALGFTAEQIVRMVSHGGGSKNLEAVQIYQDALQALGFTAEQIVRMVSHNGGSKNIDAVQANQTALQTLGFSAEQIVRIFSQDICLKNLEAAQTYVEKKFTKKGWPSVPHILLLHLHMNIPKNKEIDVTEFSVKLLLIKLEELVQKEGLDCLAFTNITLPVEINHLCLSQFIDVLERINSPLSQLAAGLLLDGNIPTVYIEPEEAVYHLYWEKRGHDAICFYEKAWQNKSDKKIHDIAQFKLWETRTVSDIPSIKTRLAFWKLEPGEQFVPTYSQFMPYTPELEPTIIPQQMAFFRGELKRPRDESDFKVKKFKANDSEEDLSDDDTLNDGPRGWGVESGGWVR